MRFYNTPSELLDWEDVIEFASFRFRGVRKNLRIQIGSYNDRNEGFNRSAFSRSKRNHSRLRKKNQFNKRRSWRFVAHRHTTMKGG